MFRLTTLTLALVALAPLSPQGCPPTEVPDELLPFDRGTLPIAASVDPDGAGYGETIQLAAVAESAGAVSYSWVQVGGAGVPIANADQASASFVAPSVPADETLHFLVTALDDSGAFGRASVSVLIWGDPQYGERTSKPTGRTRADAGADQTVLPGEDVRLDGSRSAGMTLTYRWRQVSGTTVSAIAGMNAMVATFKAPGYVPNGNNALVFELAVTDAEGHLLTDRVQVTIKDPNATEPRVTVSTSMGDFVIELNTEKAPGTTRNFLRYVDDKFYDGTIFHRVIPDFVIQGGGFSPDLEEKETRNPIASESDNGLSNIRGSVAMARTGNPDSATSQFFVNVKDNIKDGDGAANLDPGGVDPNGYTVFGTVISGLDVVDRIAGVETQSESGFDDVPIEDVIINSIRRVQTPTGGNNGSTDPTIKSDVGG